MSQNRKNKVKQRRRIRRRRNSSEAIKGFSFVDCPVAGAISIKTSKGHSLRVFDSISFFAADIKSNNFEIEGLFFDQKKGWYEKGAVLPKYYGKDVYDACINYAVDRAIKDNLYLGLAILGKERPAKTVLMISHSEIVKQLEDKGFIVSQVGA